MESKNRIGREASFSSYLPKGEENFVHNLSRSRHKNFKAEEGEISIFGAEKYFAGMNGDDDSPRFYGHYGRNHGCKNEKLVDIHLKKTNTELESKVIGRKFFTGLRCNHSCYDKNSVQIDRNPTKLKQFQPPFQLNSTGEVGLQNSSVDRQNGDISLYLERKLSMLKWDAIPNPNSIPTSSRNGAFYEDLDSDTSSDLFEIETLSGSEQLIPPRMAAAADISVISDFEAKKQAGNVKTTTSKWKGKETKKSKPANSLLGCKSDKAVRVAETVARITNEKAKTETRQRQKIGAAISAKRLQAETKMKNISFS